MPICPVVKPSLFNHSCSHFCRWFAPQVLPLNGQHPVQNKHFYNHWQNYLTLDQLISRIINIRKAPSASRVSCSNFCNWVVCSSGRLGGFIRQTPHTLCWMQSPWGGWGGPFRRGKWLWGLWEWWLVWVQPSWLWEWFWFWRCDGRWARRVGVCLSLLVINLIKGYNGYKVVV